MAQSLESDRLILRKGWRVQLHDGSTGTIDYITQLHGMFPHRVMWPVVMFDVPNGICTRMVDPNLIARAWEPTDANA